MRTLPRYWRRWSRAGMPASGRTTRQEHVHQMSPGVMPSQRTLPQGSVGCGSDIRVSEVVSLEQQRFTRNLGQRVAEAAAKIETSGMPALAIAPPGLTSDLGLFRRDRFDGEAGLCNEQIQLAAACCTITRFDQQSGLVDRPPGYRT